jgi:hypothetical protein
MLLIFIYYDYYELSFSLFQHVQHNSYFNQFGSRKEKLLYIYLKLSLQDHCMNGTYVTNTSIGK